MASTEIARLAVADLADAVALSASASWNQNEADWRLMLTLGRAWGIRAADVSGIERLAASVATLPYGSEFAWVSMVLVLPEFRGRGYATRLLAHALDELAWRGIAAILDATPAGRPIYLPLGFVDCWGFSRYRREAPTTASAARSPGTAEVFEAAAVRPLRDADWPAILGIDRPAFGADREALLRSLAARLPRAAHVAEHNGRITGFVLARDGREASQLGPLLAPDTTTARALLEAALSTLDGPVYLDLADRHAHLLPWLQSRGFAFQRLFTRMIRGLRRAPGDPTPVVLVAGPELG
ncbi:MAG: GNAT family N-acetyltransferase [Burkholderiaceae bacterium]|jgi:GNAT superfamily N-acetyltransferase|nr:GNAT family N-acetyltransferase [Burkholderiaceae bacterium]MEB2353466.1 GNAT family N-acetyltransferase [Burkholderiaceae bacterium]